MTLKNYSININQDDNDVVDVSVSNSQDFNVDKNFNDLVKSLNDVVDAITKK